MPIPPTTRLASYPLWCSDPSDFGASLRGRKFLIAFEEEGESFAVG
jgi:hypothetical protein